MTKPDVVCTGTRTRPARLVPGNGVNTQLLSSFPSRGGYSARRCICSNTKAFPSLAPARPTRCAAKYDSSQGQNVALSVLIMPSSLDGDLSLSDSVSRIWRDLCWSNQSGEPGVLPPPDRQLCTAHTHHVNLTLLRMSKHKSVPFSGSGSPDQVRCQKYSFRSPAQRPVGAIQQVAWTEEKSRNPKTLNPKLKP